MVFLHQIIGQFGGLCVGVVSTNGVNDIDTILQQLLRGNFQWRRIGGTVPFLDAVFYIGKLLIILIKNMRKDNIRKGFRSKIPLTTDPNPKKGSGHSTTKRRLAKSYLDAAVTDRRPSKVKERFALIPFGFIQNKGITRKKALVSASVKAQGESGDFAFAVGLDPVSGEESDTGTQTRSETSRGHHTNGNMSSS